MTDLSIQFRALMIRALHDGRKTQTRRKAWRIPPTEGWMQDEPVSIGGKPTKWQKVQPGDKLWVKETFTSGYDYDENDMPVGDLKIFYAATFDCDRWYDPDINEYRDKPKWSSPIHMPKWASRLTLIVTAGRIERLQKISHDDAKAEGINTGDPVEEYRLLWESINGPAAWIDNPEVIVISFDVMKENIDKLRTDVSDLVRAS